MEVLFTFDASVGVGKFRLFGGLLFFPRSDQGHRFIMTKHRQLRCLPFPEEAVSVESLSRAFGAYGALHPERPSAATLVAY